MPEVLIVMKDRLDTDPDRNRVKVKRGDTVTAMPDGSPWGRYNSKRYFDSISGAQIVATEERKLRQFQFQTRKEGSQKIWQLADLQAERLRREKTTEVWPGLYAILYLSDITLEECRSKVSWPYQEPPVDRDAYSADMIDIDNLPSNIKTSLETNFEWTGSYNDISAYWIVKNQVIVENRKMHNMLGQEARPDEIVRMGHW